MVDPHRKINNLTDEHRAFLAECEEEFANRYTDQDAEFMEHLSRKPSIPPIVDPWQGMQKRTYDNAYRGRGRGNFNRHQGGRYNNNRNGNDRQRNYQRRDYNSENRGGYHRDRKNEQQPFYGQRYNPY